MLDDRTAVDPRFTSTRHAVWDNTSNRFGWSSYLGPEWPRGEVASDAAAGRTRDFSGLPTTFIGVGDIDLFFDEDRRYAESLGSADVPVHLEVVEGAPHGFYRMAPGAPVSRAFMGSALGWLSAVVTTRSS
jgi:acetyl esterase/lipase